MGARASNLENALDKMKRSEKRLKQTIHSLFFTRYCNMVVCVPEKGKLEAKLQSVKGTKT